MKVASELRDTTKKSIGRNFRLPMPLQAAQSTQSNIQILDFQGVILDELAATLDIVAREYPEHALGWGAAF